MARVVVAQCSACGGDLKVKKQAVLKQMHLTCRCGEHQKVKSCVATTAKKQVKQLKAKHKNDASVVDDDFNVGDISIVVGIVAYVVLLPIYGLCWFFGDDPVQRFFQVMDWIICGGVVILVLLLAFSLDWSDRQDGNTVLMGSGVIISISILGICLPICKIVSPCADPMGR